VAASHTQVVFASLTEPTLTAATPAQHQTNFGGFPLTKAKFLASPYGQKVGQAKADEKWHLWIQPLISEAHSANKVDLSLEAFQLQMAELILLGSSSETTHHHPEAFPTMESLFEKVFKDADANYAQLVGWWWEQFDN
jgi:hypothetical protein